MGNIKRFEFGLHSEHLLHGVSCLCVQFSVPIEKGVVLDEYQISTLDEAHLYGLRETNNVSYNFFVSSPTVCTSHYNFNLINYSIHFLLIKILLMETKPQV